MDQAGDLFEQHGPAKRSGVEAPLYADVVVRQRARAVGTFSYAVPAVLRDKIAPGQLVEVPFRQGRLPALVVALSDQRPRFPTKELLQLIDPRPALTETQLALGRWLADYYLCSLAEALFAMLPPGLLARTRTLVALTPAGRTRSLDGLAPSSCQVVEALRQAGSEVDVTALGRTLGKKASGALGRLSRHGWLTLRSETVEAEARPYFAPFLVLVAPPAEVAAQRARLLAGRRNPPAARLLAALARAPGGTLGRQGLLREMKASAAALATLEEEGLVRSEAEQRRLYLVAMEEDVSSFPLPHSPPEVALVYRIRDAGGAIDLEEAGAPAEVCRALVRQGLLREEVRPARVRLAVLPEVALERAAAFRRTRADEKQAALLQALEEAADRALPITVLYGAVSGATRQDVRALVEAGLCREEERELLRDPLAGQQSIAQETPPPLTEHQGRVWREVYDAFGKGGQRTFLLHGVTGSGKTEIYLRALGRCLREGRQALVLVPEISLTPQAVRRFLARFPGKVTVLHSGLTVGERYDQWRRVRGGQVDVVIGPRSALFAPLPRLGLIVVDEEHDASYKQDDLAPRYHARETALALARLTGSVTILGSATPAVESYARAQRGVYRLLELPERIRVREDAAGVRQALIDRTMPQVQVVDMREELRAGNLSIFSRPLQLALRQVLDGGEQAILFLNRRGAATFVMCRECGYVVRCPRCEVPFVYHAEENRLLCHRCGRQAPSPPLCPQCSSSRIRHFGAGTERVVAEVERFFPKARVLRWDRDATRQRGAPEEMLDAFIAHRADVLVGTQLVAKGLDLPLVTLVGVVSADTSLHLPDFRSAERTFQLLTQVIGRAGRRAERGRAIVQTYHPDNEAIQAAARQDYAAFFRQELAYRQRYGYPPFGQLARLIYCHSQEERCQEETSELADVLRRRAATLPEARLIGPAPAFVSRRRGQYRWQLLVLAPDVHPILKGLDLSPGWAVDVDPASLLT
jgi:primosomal protein N' (replication factor Y)